MATALTPRRQQLKDWLAKVEARQLANMRGPNGSWVTIYQARLATFIIQCWDPPSVDAHRKDADISWDLYIPASLTTDSRLTLEAAEEFIFRANNERTV